MNLRFMRVFRHVITTISTLTLLVVASNNLHGQNDSHKSPYNTVIVGELPDTFKIVGVVKYDYNQYRGLSMSSRNTSRFEVPVKNGRFTYKFQIDHPIYLLFDCVPANFSAFNGMGSASFDTNGLLIEPGDSIHFDARVSLKAQTGYPSVTFSGRGAEKHWCIQEIIRNTDLYRCPLAIRYYGASPREELALSDSVANMISKTADIFKHKLSPAVFSLIKVHYINSLSEDVSDIFIRSGFDLKKNNVKLLYRRELASREALFHTNDNNLIYGSSYVTNPIVQRALLDYSISKNIDYPLTQFGTHELRTSEGPQNYKAEYYHEIARRMPSGSLKNRVLSDFIVYVINKTGVDAEVRKMVSEYLASTDSKSSFYSGIKGLSMEFESLKGAKAFPFELPDTTGKLHSQKDFIGKVVLLDFMFNGCGGCRAMVPTLTIVEEHFRNNKAVSFISVSIDTEVDGQFGWKTGIGKFSVASSLQLNLRQGDNSAMCKYYNITGYPTLVLIGKDGKVLTTRASDPRYDNGKGLIKMIEEALAAN
ncbi:TlpA family protein disulfide reductase [Chitinophaga defluvii]|uniref:TlpA disulfide reductase family protein n=1 Tax=Chitinophaga defluvii TaxID=3163343 RepID=A0ABV2T8Q6_9BACT